MQKKGETINDYGYYIYVQGLISLNEFSDKARDELIRETFLAGLIPDIRDKINLIPNIATYDDALMHAERIE